MRGKLRPPLAIRDVSERQPVAESLDSDSDQPDAHPAVESGMEQAQLGGAGRQLEEAERGAERGQAPVGHDMSNQSAASARAASRIVRTHNQS